MATAMRQLWLTQKGYIQAYLDTNDIPEEKCTSVLISTIGHRTYAVLRTSWHPTVHQSRSYDALVQARSRNIINPSNQSLPNDTCLITHPGQSITAELRRPASTCNFDNFPMMHCAIALCGVTSEKSRRRLLADADDTTTFGKAMELAQSFEQAVKYAGAVNGTEALLKKY